MTSTKRFPRKWFIQMRVINIYKNRLERNCFPTANWFFIFLLSSELLKRFIIYLQKYARLAMPLKGDNNRNSFFFELSITRRQIRKDFLLKSIKSKNTQEKFLQNPNEFSIRTSNQKSCLKCKFEFVELGKHREEAIFPALNFLI